MRHRVGNKRLGRPTDQRLAIIKSLVAGVLDHGHVTTTEVRAKAAMPVIEKLITLGREDTLHNRRMAMRWIPVGQVITTRAQYQNVHGEKPGYKGHLKGADRRPSGDRLLDRLFEDIGPLFKDRPGGYLRIIRLGGEPHMNPKGRLTIRGARRGDGATMVRIELVE